MGAGICFWANSGIYAIDTCISIPLRNGVCSPIFPQEQKPNKYPNKYPNKFAIYFTQIIRWLAI